MKLVFNKNKAKKEIKAGDVLVIKAKAFGHEANTVLVFRSEGEFILIGLDGKNSWGLYGDCGFKTSNDIHGTFTIAEHFSSEEYNLRAEKKSTWKKLLKIASQYGK